MPQSTHSSQNGIDAPLAPRPADSHAIPSPCHQTHTPTWQTGIVFPDAPVQYLDSSPEYLTQSVDIALAQLGTKYIDVLMPHAPDPLLVRGGASVGRWTDGGGKWPRREWPRPPRRA